MTTSPRIDLFTLGQTAPANGWLVSDWAAGQTPIMSWADENVRHNGNGDVELVLNAGSGSGRPYRGGEVQSDIAATTGTFNWTAQAPKMKDGAVFGMFTYRDEWHSQPWVEFDFEFVGANTTEVQLNIHMETASGKHVTLHDTKGGPVKVDLGFDASKGMHHYEVTVTQSEATFRVDGKVVGVFGPDDMPGGIWRLGPQKSYVDLWAASGLEEWTGHWRYDGNPLVAKLRKAEVLVGDHDGSGNWGDVPDAPAAPDSPTEPDTDAPQTPPVVQPDVEPGPLPEMPAPNMVAGGWGRDWLVGTEGADVVFGGMGKDWMTGAAGADVFVFRSTSETGVGRVRDVIYDFEQGTDLIDLSAIDANRHRDGVQDFDVAQRGTAYAVWLTDRDGVGILRGDVNGDRRPDFEIRLDGIDAVTADDFLF